MAAKKVYHKVVQAQPATNLSSTTPHTQALLTNQVAHSSLRGALRNQSQQSSNESIRGALRNQSKQSSNESISASLLQSSNESISTRGALALFEPCHERNELDSNLM